MYANVRNPSTTAHFHTDKAWSTVEPLYHSLVLTATVARAPKPTLEATDRRDRELHPDSYRRSCSRRLRVVISIKGFDSPFVRTTTPALEDGANTTAARKPGFSPL
jgi:hypothetical protein